MSRLSDLGTSSLVVAVAVAVADVDADGHVSEVSSDVRVSPGVERFEAI